MEFNLNKNQISCGSFEDSKVESQNNLLNSTPLERLEMLEFLRSQTYGKTCTAPRLQRSFEVILRS